MSSFLNVGALVVGTFILTYAAKSLVEGLVGTPHDFAVPPFILAMLIISIDLEEFSSAVAFAWLLLLVVVLRGRKFSS